jgi:hypothetical protein
MSDAVDFEKAAQKMYAEKALNAGQAAPAKPPTMLEQLQGKLMQHRMDMAKCEKLIDMLQDNPAIVEFVDILQIRLN